MRCRQSWTEEQHWLNSPLWEGAGFLPLSFEKGKTGKGWLFIWLRKKKKPTPKPQRREELEDDFYDDIEEEEEKMSKAPIIILAIAIIVVAGLIAFMLLR